MKVVILAGGLGERLRPITNYIPKALVPMNGVPMLKLQMDFLFDIGNRDFLILAGYRSDMVRAYAEGLDFGEDAKIEIIETPESYSPAMRLLNAQKQIGNDFMIVYCDNFVDDSDSILAVTKSSAECTLLVEQRKIGNVSLGSWSRYHLERSELQPYVDLGFIRVKSEYFFNLLNQEKSLPHTLSMISDSQKLATVVTTSKLLSTSTIDRFNNQRSHRKTLLIDRDGILNEKMPSRVYLTSFDQYKPIVENRRFLTKLCSRGIDVVIATNQPGIATGELDEQFLDNLHSRMIVELLLLGIPVIGLYVCPHHWDDNCECRKPKPGMLESSITDYDLKKESLVYIGDEEKDQIAAHACGIEGIVIGQTDQYKRDYFKAMPDSEERIIEILSARD